MDNPEVSISPPRQETNNPETNRVDSLEGLFYAAGKITRRSMADKRAGIERSLQLRAKRAQIFKDVEQTPKEDKETRWNLINEAKKRDELERQYLNQGDVTVDIPGLGPQSARYTIIELPQDLKPKDTPEQPPIFFIPGLSNDLDCVSSTLEELAYNGRRVIAVGFPESFMGKVTPEFAQAAKQSTDFEPHVTFFKEAANKLLGGGDSQIEFWSHSAGGPVVEQILNDPEFQERTANAVLLNPAASADMSKPQAAAAFLKEAGHLFRRFGQLPRYVFTGGTRDGEPEGQRALVQVFNGLADRVLRQSNLIEGARVKKDGKIIVLTGTHDTVTKAHKAKDMFTANPQVTFIEDPEGYHFTALTLPEKTIATVNRHLHPPTAH